MACVAAAHATWIPKEAEAATASFPLQPPSPSSSAVDDPANESQRPCPLVAGLAPTGMEVLVVEVGEPGLPRAPRGGGAEVGPADTSAKPGSQYWIVGHGAWQSHPRRVEATRPKGRRFRAASVVSSLRGLLRRRFGRRSIRSLSSSTRQLRPKRMLETVLEDEPEWRETLYIECVEFVTGGRN